MKQIEGRWGRRSAYSGAGQTVNFLSTLKRQLPPNVSMKSPNRKGTPPALSGGRSDISQLPVDKWHQPDGRRPTACIRHISSI